MEPGVYKGVKESRFHRNSTAALRCSRISPKRSTISLLVTIMRTAGMNFDNPTVKNTVDQTVFIIYVPAPITG